MLSIIYSNYYQCLGVVQIKHGKQQTCKRKKQEGNEMHQTGDEEGDLECKSMRAIQLLHEVTPFLYFISRFLACCGHGTGLGSEEKL